MWLIQSGQRFILHADALMCISAILEYIILLLNSLQQPAVKTAKAKTLRIISFQWK